MILTDRQADLLVEIYTDPGRALRDYAARLGVTYCAALRHLRTLRSLGFVWRYRCRALRRYPGQTRPPYRLFADAFPAAVTIDGKRCRLVLLDPPPGDK